MKDSFTDYNTTEHIWYAANKSICKSRAGQRNISYEQAAAAVPAGRSIFSFSS